MTLIQGAILGLVEGLTEFLPVSSTGHMVLASTLLHIASSDFVKSFEIVVQLGAITAVALFYLRSFLDIEVLKRLIVGFIPTGIAGLLAYHVVKTYLLGNPYVVVFAIGIGGIALIVFELWHTQSLGSERITDITLMQSLFVGVFQAIAIIPGVSRSGATIVGGLALGISRSAIVEFSFLLAVPTMVAASGFDVVKNYRVFAGADWGVLAVGFIVAFVVALFSIKFLLSYIRTHTFVPFGVYRIVVALVFWFVVLS